MKRIMVIAMAFAIICGTVFTASASATQLPKTSHTWNAWANTALTANMRLLDTVRTFSAFASDNSPIPNPPTYEETLLVKMSNEALAVAGAADSPSPVLNRALVQEATNFNHYAWDEYQRLVTRRLSTKLVEQDGSRCYKAEYVFNNLVDEMGSDKSIMPFAPIWTIYTTEVWMFNG
jgi:hypothetical protein